jgi:2-oxoisovalerate ferredoxin oxidoreductase beta subunit
MTPLEGRKWIEEKMLPVFPLKVYQDRKKKEDNIPGPEVRPVAEVLKLESGGNGRGAGAKRVGARDPGLKLKIAGFGGQGILLLGQLLAEMGLREGLEVSWLPSYGPEMRSGSAHCHVCLSGERIGSPLVEHPDVLIAMNEISLRKFGPQVKDGGLILYNAMMPPENFDARGARMICVPASDTADKLGAAKVANVVMLGALLSSTEALPEETAKAVLEGMVKNAALVEANRKALEAGRESVMAGAGC